jgi:hypothetical protein
MGKANKKPLTHCEKYGHTWVSSTSPGFEVCSYRNLLNGKEVPCLAARRVAESPVRVNKRRSSSVSSHASTVQQVSLWES